MSRGLCHFYTYQKDRSGVILSGGNYAPGRRILCVLYLSRAFCRGDYVWKDFPKCNLPWIFQANSYVTFSVILLTDLLPYLAMVNMWKSGPVTLTMKFNRVLVVARYTFMQNYIELSAAGHELSYEQRNQKKLSNDAETILSSPPRTANLSAKCRHNMRPPA